MHRMIFVSLPVTNLGASIAFYSALGFKLNPAFTDDTAACLGWSESIHVMLLTHAKWRGFTGKPIPPPASSEVSLGLLCESRAEVDKMLQAAKDHGGIADINPVQEMEFMYGRDLQDPDGHVLGPFWMDPAALPKA